MLPPLRAGGGGTVVAVAGGWTLALPLSSAPPSSSAAASVVSASTPKLAVLRRWGGGALASPLCPTAASLSREPWCSSGPTMMLGVAALWSVTASLGAWDRGGGGLKGKQVWRGGYIYII